MKYTPSVGTSEVGYFAKGLAGKSLRYRRRLRYTQAGCVSQRECLLEMLRQKVVDARVALQNEELLDDARQGPRLGGFH